MTIKNFAIIIFYTGISLLISCADKEPVPLISSDFDHGVFIINEGNFSDSDGSLSYFDHDSQKVTNQIFEKINDRPFAGLFQSARFYGDRGYFIDQLGRIEVVRADDLLSVFSISTNLDIPRFFAAYENTGFVTDWGPYDENFVNNESKIKIYDLSTMNLDTEIKTASRPEDIFVIKDKIFVANSATNIISIYNPLDNTLIKELEVPFGPTGFVKDKADNLWVICTGAYISTGAMAGLDTDNNDLLFNLDLADYTPNGRLAIDGKRETIYFMTEQWNPDFSTENTIYQVKLTIKNTDPVIAEWPVEVVSGRNWYGLGVDPVHDMLYVADAVGFQGNGTVYRYDLEGNLLDEFFVGRGPRDFIFRNE